MTELPGRESFAQQVFGKAEVYDFVLAPLAVLTLALSAYDFAWRHAYVRAAVVTVAGLAVLAAGMAKAIVNYRAKQQPRQTHELEGCLETLHAVLVEQPDVVDGADGEPIAFRLTLHKPVAGGEEFEQVLEYVGIHRRPDNPQAGRRFPAQAGATGRALRRQRTVVGRRATEDLDAFVAELIADWSYTEAGARAVSPNVRSWLAIPLLIDEGNGRTVLGVLWADCDRRDFFTDRRVTTAEAACVGIARFVVRRYTRA